MGNSTEGCTHNGRRRFFMKLGATDDRCEVIDPRTVHPHGSAGHKHHDHAHPRDTDKRRLLLAVGISAVVLVAEVIGGVLSGSIALLSDAGHMLTDLSAQILSLLALVFASRPADAKRTFGYYRLEILAALANGIVLVVLAIFVIVKAIGRIDDPHPVHAGIMLPVAVVGLIANLAGAWLLHGAHTLNVRGAYLHVLSDAMTSVVVIVGGVLMVWKGWYVVDPILGVLIAGVVLLSAYRLLREATDVLLEAVPTGLDLEKVREDVRTVGGIEDVHDLHIWTITSGIHALSAHIVVSVDATVASNDELLTRIKQVLLHRHQIAHSTLQIESTVYEHVSHLH
jgi:cobalt-zinc-cadmium efflux system protein